MDKVYEVIDSITKRLGNPFLVSFALSWLVSNWKAVLVAMSTDHYLVKIAYLEKVLYGPDTNPQMRLFWIPLLAAGVYVFILPLAATIATAVGGLYDNLNEWVKSKVLRLRVLTLKQSQTLQAEMEATFNKLSDENQLLSTARIDSTKKAGETATQVLNLTLGSVFEFLKKDAPGWTDVEKMPSTRTLGNQDQDRDNFAKEWGVPKQWLKIFDPTENLQSFSVQRAAKVYDIDEVKTMKILFNLIAIGLIQQEWVDDQFRFKLAGGTWGNLLNGRPA